MQRVTTMRGSWLQALDLSVPGKKNPERDPANGFTVAEIQSWYDKGGRDTSTVLTWNGSVAALFFIQKMFNCSILTKERKEMQFNKQDWFLCHSFSSADFPAASDPKFREELAFQIRRQVLLQRPDGVKSTDDSFLQSIDIRVDDRRLEQFRQFCVDRLPLATRSSSGVNAQPAFLTFHGTSNPTALNSIVEHGFLMPGQQHPRFGFSLNMRVGNLYGDGVYSSSKVHVAASYAAWANDSSVQVIVSIVAPGRVHYVGSEPFTGLPPYPHASGSKQGWKRQEGMLTPGCETGTYPYADDANTLTPDFSTMWICGDSRQILPVAVVTLSLLPFQSVESWNNRQRLHAKPIADDGKAPVRDDKNTILLTHLCEDFYAFPDKIFREISRRPVLRRSYVLPKSLLFDKSFVSAFSSHVKKCGLDSTHGAHGPVHLYGLSGSVALNLKHFESTYANHMKREKRFELAHGLRAALEDIIASPVAAEHAYHILIVAVDQTSFFSQKDLDELAEVYRHVHKRFYINVKLVFSPAFADSVSCKKETVLGVKNLLQAEGIYESHFISAGETKWPVALDIMDDELHNIGSHNTSETYLGNFSCEGVKIEVGAEFYGEGMFVGIDKTPVWSGVFHHRVLFKGVPPRTISINDSTFDVLIARLKPTSRKENDRRSGEATRSGDDAAQVTSESQHFWKYNRCPIPLEKIDITDETGSSRSRSILSNVACLVSLLAAFRNSLVHDKEKLIVYRGAVERIATGILCIARDCDVLDSAASATLSQATASVVGEIRMLSSVKFSGDLYDSFQRMRFGKKLIGRISAEEANSCLPKQLTDATASNTLAHWHDQLGIPVRVKISDASAIEPWNVIVEYVTSAPSRVPVSVVYRAALVDECLVDCFGHQITDVVLCDVGNGDDDDDDDHEKDETAPRHASGNIGLTSRQKMYLYNAFVQTRNPMLSLRQQGIALQTVTWIRAVESLLLRARFQGTTAAVSIRDIGSAAPPNEIVALAITLAERTHSYFSKWISRDAPLEYFVNWSAVLQCKSIAQLFGILAAASVLRTGGEGLCVNNQPAVEIAALPVKLKFDVLAETLVRLTRSFANSTRQNEQQLLQWLFGMQKDAVESDDVVQLDITRALRRTQRILKVSATNCSPFAAVASFGFLEQWRIGDGTTRISEIVKSFSSRKISMSSFFQAICEENWTPQATQLALFVWAIKTHRNGVNRPRFTDTCQDPERFVQQEFTDLLETLRADFLRRLANVAGEALRRSRRAKAREEEAASFRDFHRVPKIFSRADVIELEKNRERVAPSDIPFTLLPNGLLAHHCCYPECPKYLQACVTELDLVALREGKLRRNGMRRHLEPNKLTGNYIPNFHLMGKKLAARSGGSFEAFEEQMKQHFGQTAEFANMPRQMLLLHLQAVWSSVQTK